MSNYINSKAIQEITKLWKIIIANKLYRILLGIFTGAVIGFLYWKFIGCTSGSCPLTSNPFSTLLIFSLMGAVLAWDKNDKPELIDKKEQK